MTKKIVISTPYPSPRAVAKKLGVSKERADELIQMIDVVHASSAPRIHARRKSAARKKSAGRRPA